MVLPNEVLQIETVDCGVDQSSMAFGEKSSWIYRLLITFFAALCINQASAAMYKICVILVQKVYYIEKAVDWDSNARNTNSIFW